MRLVSGTLPVWRDGLVAALAAAWAFIVLSGAKDDFSYDFGNYIGYFDRLAGFDIEDFINNLEEFAPYPYIFVPPAGLFEVGFAFLTWTLLSTGLSSATVYALIGSASIAIRLVILRSLGMRWPLITLISIYSITLFEANAIRLGVALTICTAALLAMVRGRGIFALFLLVIASLSHLQAIAFALPAVFLDMVFKGITHSPTRRLILLTAVLLASVAGAITLQLLDFAKFADYAERASGATGINAVSVAALLLMATGAYSFVAAQPGPGDTVQFREARAWGGSFISACPALVVLIIATEMGAVGDRVWQFAFSMLVGSYPLLIKHYPRTIFFRLSVWLCLLISVISITVRYPLSNFFAPIIPYTPITPLSLIT